MSAIYILCDIVCWNLFCACFWHLFLSTATAITPTITASSAVSRNVKRNVSPIARLRSLSSSSHLTLEDAVILSTGEEKKLIQNFITFLSREFYIMLRVSHNREKERRHQTHDYQE